MFYLKNKPIISIYFYVFNMSIRAKISWLKFFAIAMKIIISHTKIYKN